MRLLPKHRQPPQRAAPADITTAVRPSQAPGGQPIDGVYRVTEVIGVSSDSWEAAARNAVEAAGKGCSG
jgi:hypothetical protein